MLLGTLGNSMLGNMLPGQWVIRAGKGVLRTGTGHDPEHEYKILVQLHPLSNIEIRTLSLIVLIQEITYLE